MRLVRQPSGAGGQSEHRHARALTQYGSRGGCCRLCAAVRRRGRRALLSRPRDGFPSRVGMMRERIARRSTQPWPAKTVTGFGLRPSLAVAAEKDGGKIQPETAIRTSQ